MQNVSYFKITINNFCSKNVNLRFGKGRECFIYSYMASDMVNDQSDNERGNLLLPSHELLFPISSKESDMHDPTYRIVHTMTYITLVVEHWLEQAIAE